MCLIHASALKYVDFIRQLLQSHQVPFMWSFKDEQHPGQNSKTTDRIISIDNGWNSLDDFHETACRRKETRGHTFGGYNKTSTLGRTAVDSLDNIDQLKAHKSRILLMNESRTSCLLSIGQLLGVSLMRNLTFSPPKRSLTFCYYFRYQDQS
jgi:hypothetical protein